MARLMQIAEAVGTSYDFIDSLIRRELLATPLGEAGPGVARAFTHENALEIAFIAALVSIGHAPMAAGAIAGEWLSMHARGALAAWWVQNRVSGAAHFFESALGKMTVQKLFEDGTLPDDGGEGALASECDDEHGPPEGYRPATRIAIIHIAEIVKRVDALFDTAPRRKSHGSGA